MGIAVLLAGGAGTRLGGRHKPAITVAGHTLLDRALAAVRDADRVVVVGPPQPTRRTVRWTREDPPGGGPVAALAAGLAGETDIADETDVVVLATDLAKITAGTIDRLRAALAKQPDQDGVVLCDHAGRRQWLIGVWRAGSLRAALPAQPQGASLHATLGGLAVATLPEWLGESADIDTLTDLTRLLIEHDEGGGPSRPSHW